MTTKEPTTLETVTLTAPGPRGLPLVGVLHQLRRDPLHFLTEMAHRYGDVVALPLGNQSAFLINNPDGVKHVLATNRHNYRRGDFYEKMKALLGEGLLTSDGDFWQQQRQLIQPAFHRSRIIGMTGLIVEAISQMLTRWEGIAQSKVPFDVLSEMMRVTQVVITRSMFSTNMSEEMMARVGKAVMVGQATAEQRFWSFLPIPTSLPTPQNRRFDRAVATIDQVVYGLIEARQSSGERPDDLLSMLLEATDAESGRGMSRQQLRDELVTTYLAGHETTSVSLAWAWYLLSLYPAVARRIREEADEVFQGRLPTYEDVSKLVYTEQVVQEVLRLYPSAWLISRVAVESDTIDGYAIPAGATVLLSPYVVHRHPAHWENPAGFDPERFTPERIEARHRHAHLPFGAGPHICIGNRLALLEAQLVLAMVAQRYRLDHLPHEKVRPQPQISLKPGEHLMMMLHSHRS